MMTRLQIVLASLLVAATAVAFDSEAWMEKRNDATEMNRLKAAYEKYAGDTSAPADNLTIPIELYKDGRIKTRLTAARAKLFPQEGYVWAEDIVIEQYKPDGAIAARLSAENCVVDRNAKSGWSRGFATATSDGYTISGRGIYFSLEREFITITSDSEIRMSAKTLDLRSIM